MASTWTTNNAIEKIADGEKSNTWGQITNRNFDIVDQATNGIGAITVTGNADLSTSDGTVGDSIGDGVNKVLVLSGSLSAGATLTVTPNDAQKLYFVVNNAGDTVTFTQGTGGDVEVPNGETKVIYCDGGGASAEVVELIDDLSVINVTTLGTSEANRVVTADANGDVYVADDLRAERYTDTYVDLTAAATVDIDCETGNVFSLTLDQATTLTFSNPPASDTAYFMALKIIQDASASEFAVTFPTIKWPSGEVPQLSTGADQIDQFTFYTHDGGTTWYGFLAGRDMS
jgi:hypothetical protein